jgi:aminoglycoside phosphotransferase (APT) family kinase protein
MVELSHAQGGQANETILVDLGPLRPGLVVRLPPLEPTFPDYDLAPQALVQNIVASSGVPAPAPAVVEPDPEWIGSPFLIMPRVVGDIPGPAPFFDPYVRDAGPARQRVMHDQLIDVMAQVHAVDWEAGGLEAVLPGAHLRQAVERWVGYVQWSSEGDPLPALEQALDWCARHVPAERAGVLLWGDVRLGNLVFDPERRVTAVLDWDLASLGPREMDLGWHIGLEFMTPRLPRHGRSGRALRAALRIRGARSRLARSVRLDACAGHQRPPSADHGRCPPAREPYGGHSAGAPGSRLGRRRVMAPDVVGQGIGSRSEKPMTPALATS